MADREMKRKAEIDQALREVDQILLDNLPKIMESAPCVYNPEGLYRKTIETKTSSQNTSSKFESRSPSIPLF